MDPSKVQCVLQWPVLKNVKGIRGFLGSHLLLPKIY